MIALAHRRSAAVLCEESTAARLRTKPLTGTLHSVFRRVLNVRERDSDRLFALASADVDLAPDTLVLSLDSFEPLACLPGQRILVTQDYLAIGSRVHIAFSAQRVVNLTLPSWPSSPALIGRRLNEARQALVQLGKGGGMLPQANAPPFNRQVSARLAELQDQLVTIIREQRRADFLPLAREMLGLGPGLTPSGDDFLAGLCLSFTIPHLPLSSWRDLGIMLACDANVYTGEISCWELDHAVRGYPRRQVESFLRSLFGTERQPLSPQVEQLVATGATSGTDFLTGLLAGLELALNANTKYKQRSKINGSQISD